MKLVTNLALLIFFVPAIATATEISVCALMKRAHLAMAVTAANIVNVTTTRIPDGGAYRVKDLICKSDTCEIFETAKVKSVFEPTHQDADSNGYVSYPDIDVNEEAAQMEMLTQIYEKARMACHGPAAVSNSGQP